MATTSTQLANHPQLSLKAVGKVREIYSINSDPAHLLFVTTDRISAFDIVLSTGIPNKGAILTMLSKFWFEYFRDVLPEIQSHFVSLGLPRELESCSPDYDNTLKQRSMVVKHLDVFPIESIVRGYLTGSAWATYQKDGTVNGIKVPSGLRESDKLPEILWTPSTKASGPGEHDEYISAEQAAEIVGKEYARQIESISKRLYSKALEFAATKGIIIVDTKFEFALDKKTSPPTVVLCDEVLTPDSSRFWSLKDYRPGVPQPSLDKQPLRDWLKQNDLKDKEYVSIPDDVVKATEERYRYTYEVLTGKKLNDE